MHDPLKPEAATQQSPELSEVKRALLEKMVGGALPQSAIGAVLRRVQTPVEASTTASPRVPIAVVQRGGSKRPFFYLHVHWQGGPIYCFNLARQLGPDYPVYLLDPYRCDDLDAAPPVEVIAADYIQSMRSVQPEGPYLLGGFCGASVIAYEMAQQLRAQGASVDLLLFVEPMTGPIRLSRMTGRVVRLVGRLGLRRDQQMDWFLRLRHLLRVIRRSRDEFTDGAELLMRTWGQEHRRRFLVLPPAGALRLDWLAVFAWPVSGYVPRPYLGRMTYILARGNPNNRQLWWGAVKPADNVEIQMVSGDNETCRTVYRDELADAMRQAIMRAQSAAPASPST
jgi:hypothetical protein